MELTGAHRVTTVDVVRGFALGGILPANLVNFVAVSLPTGALAVEHTGWWDRSALWLVSALFVTKFYLLFAFLFGYSFTLSDRESGGLRGRYLRRLLGLFVLGVCHGTLLYWGDILTGYALLGLGLWWCRGLRPGRAVRAAAGILLTLTLLVALVALAVSLAGAAGAVGQSAAAAFEPQYRAFQSGLAATLASNLATLPVSFGVGLCYLLPSAFAMFLLGLAAGRVRWLEPGARSRRQLRRLQWGGFALGLPGAVLFALTEHGLADQRLWLLALNTLLAPALAAAYLASVVRLVDSGRAPRLSAALAAAGRMSLTNYLAQSLVLALLFTGLGLGLAGQVSPLTALGVVLVGYPAQLVASRWWLARFRYGPVEWLLRTFTRARPGAPAHQHPAVAPVAG